MKILKQLKKILSGYSPLQRRRSLILGASVGLLIAILGYFNQDHTWMRFADNLVQRTWIDRYYSVYSDKSSNQYIASSASLISKEFTENLALIVFDDSSLRSGLSWPIDRSLYKELVRKIKIAGAKTIAFDIIFSGPSDDPNSDNALKEAMSDPAVIVPYGLRGNETSISRGLLYPTLIDDWSKEEFEHRLGFTMEVSDPIDKRVRLAVLKVSPPNGIEGSAHYSLNVMALAHYLGISPEEVLKRHSSRLEKVDLTLSGSPYAFPATVGRIAYCGSDLISEGQDSEQELKDKEFEENEFDALEGRIGTAQTTELKLAKTDILPISDYIQVWSVQDILSTPDEELPGLFGVKVDEVAGTEVPNKVLAVIGVNVPGGYDIKMSDVGNISGVSIHANIIWNLMQGTFLSEYRGAFTIAFTLGLAVIATILATYFETKWASLLFILLVIGYWFCGYRLMYANYFSTGGTIIPVFLPWVGALTSFGVVTLRNVLVEKRARQTMHDALADVLPVPNIEDWVNNRGLEIGSEERILTILFSDIRGYTDLSETLNPVDITEMLNTYHEAMGSIFAHYGGIIFDYQGDAQMVVFGLAPASQPNHAAAAVKAATGMILRLEQLRSEWIAQKRPVFECGIGVCTGSVALGVIGSKYRKQICAIGDPTNTSARMQGKSKELRCPVLMTETTFKAAGEAISAHYIQAVSVKGKREPLNVYGVDIEAMRPRLVADGLILDELVLVIVAITYRLTKKRALGSGDKAKLKRLLESEAQKHKGMFVELLDSKNQIALAVFGWGEDPPADRNRAAIDTIRGAIERTKSESQDNIFACAHSGFGSIVRGEDGIARLQGEAGQLAADLCDHCQNLQAEIIVTETVFLALEQQSHKAAISTYKVPNKKQSLALYSLEL